MLEGYDSPSGAPEHHSLCRFRPYCQTRLTNTASGKSYSVRRTRLTKPTILTIGQERATATRPAAAKPSTPSTKAVGTRERGGMNHDVRRRVPQSLRTAGAWLLATATSIDSAPCSRIQR